MVENLLSILLETKVKQEVKNGRYVYREFKNNGNS